MLTASIGLFKKRLLLFTMMSGALYGPSASISADADPITAVNLFNGFKRSAQVKVEIADTEQSRRKGLMFRQTLGEMEGMLFIFERESMRYFWMKNTLIPLDIIFISKGKRVVSMIRSATPCKKAPCANYRSERPATYALEVNAGFIDRHGISAGTRVEFLR